MVDLPDDLFVQNNIDELLKYDKEFFFKVRIKQAISLPKNLNNNAFVTYQFKFDKGQIYQTPEVVVKGKDNIWNYEKIHSIDKITPGIVKELREGSISY